MSQLKKKKKKRSDFWLQRAPPTPPHILTISVLSWPAHSFSIFSFSFFLKHSSHSLTLSHWYHTTPQSPPSFFQQDH